MLVVLFVLSVFAVALFVALGLCHAGAWTARHIRSARAGEETRHAVD